MVLYEDINGKLASDASTNGFFQELFELVTATKDESSEIEESSFDQNAFNSYFSSCLQVFEAENGDFIEIEADLCDYSDLFITV